MVLQKRVNQIRLTQQAKQNAFIHRKLREGLIGRSKYRERTHTTQGCDETTKSQGRVKVPALAAAVGISNNSLAMAKLPMEESAKRHEILICTRGYRNKFHLVGMLRFDRKERLKFFADWKDAGPFCF